DARGARARAQALPPRRAARLPAGRRARHLSFRPLHGGEHPRGLRLPDLRALLPGRPPALTGGVSPIRRPLPGLRTPLPVISLFFRDAVPGAAQDGQPPARIGPGTLERRTT